MAREAKFMTGRECMAPLRKWRMQAPPKYTKSISIQGKTAYCSCGITETRQSIEDIQTFANSHLGEHWREHIQLTEITTTPIRQKIETPRPFPRPASFPEGKFAGVMAETLAQKLRRLDEQALKMAKYLRWLDKQSTATKEKMGIHENPSRPNNRYSFR